MSFDHNRRPVYRIPVRRIDNGRPVMSNNRRPYPDHTVRQSGSTQLPSQPAAAVEKPQPIARDEVGRGGVAERDWQAVATRLQADMDNFRRRQLRRAEEAIAEERERLLKRFLPVADNLARALAFDDQAETSLLEGMVLVQRQLLTALQAEGVEVVPSLGQPFDPTVHEAVTTAPSAEPSGMVIEEIEPGYTIAGRLLRPAQVVVAA